MTHTRRTCALAMGLASTLLFAPSAHATEAVVDNFNELEAALQDNTVTVIYLWEDWVDPIPAYPLTADLGGTEKKVVAYDHSLPLLKVGNGHITISGGRIDAATAEAYAEMVSTTGTAGFLTQHFFKTYGDTTLVFDGTVIDVPPEDDALPSLPPTIVELRSSYASPIDFGIVPSAGAAVEFRNITTGTHPLTRALAITADLWAMPSDVLLQTSELDIASGAVIHAGWWEDDEATAVVPESRIRINQSLLHVGHDIVDDTLVGLTISPTGSDRVRLPFIHGAGWVGIQSSRLSNLRTWGEPLIIAPRVELKEAMVDTLVMTPVDTSQASIAESENVAVYSSLVCGVEGGGALFKATEAFDPTFETPRSVYLLNSVLWHLQEPLFSLDIPSGTDRDGSALTESGLVAANLTVHHALQGDPGAATTAFGIRPDDSHGFPRGALLNTYFQGSWHLGELVEPTSDGAEALLNANNVVMADPGGITAPCTGQPGCSDSDERHLADAFVAQPCGDVMDLLAHDLLYPATDDGPGFDGSLRDLDPADFPELADRPALLRVDINDPGTTWAYPDPDGPGDWGTDEVHCEAISDDNDDLAVGAWSGGSGTCSLPLLEPYDAEPEEEEGDDPESTDEPGDSVVFGLASGCRYSAAGLILLLPWSWRRRRDT